MPRIVSRTMTLVLAIGFAVVGIAGAASAHHNTITGTVGCKTGGGWAVTWRVVNSEQITETITGSNRTSAVPVGTQLSGGQTRSFTETVTTRPTAPVTLTLAARWTNNVTATNSGGIAVEAFSTDCEVTSVTPPSVPVVDDCGPGNAHFGVVPSGPWTSVTNPDGSLTITADAGYDFGNGQTSVTVPAPVDSDQPCPSSPPTETPVVTPPPVYPTEVLPAQVRVVQGKARKLDKCGTRSDLYRVAKRAGVIYKANGKVVQKGVWLRAKTRKVTIRAIAADSMFRLKGQQKWRMRFTSKACAQAPEVAPHTGR